MMRRSYWKLKYLLSFLREIGKTRNLKLSIMSLYIMQQVKHTSPETGGQGEEF